MATLATCRRWLAAWDEETRSASTGDVEAVAVVAVANVMEVDEAAVEA